MSRSSINISLTTCALLISTGIRAATFALDLYHALVILSWVNITTFTTVHLVTLAQQIVHGPRVIYGAIEWGSDVLRAFRSCWCVGVRDLEGGASVWKSARMQFRDVSCYPFEDGVW